MRVRTATLLAIAGVFWIIAGVNVVIVGVRAYARLSVSAGIFVLLILGTAAIFALFFFRIFRPYAGRQKEYVDSLGTRPVSPLKCMEPRGYLMIAVMIALGLTLRLAHFVPEWFIAFFYVGLGTALALTGILLLGTWKEKKKEFDAENV